MNTQDNEISFSADAIVSALDLRKNNPEWENLSLRLYIEGKGCDGFYYGVSFDDPKPGDIKMTQTLGNESVDLLVDTETLKYTSGSKVVWVDDERGKGFLVENPNHRRFRGKFFKRSNWEQRLLKND
ncbi:MAG: iron-sulfur cluster assembly accessory protein [Oligoflexales bacterium]|nr:iron-sulfur cluster assembly accessory protein [Oligoflexales bacterium]